MRFMGDCEQTETFSRLFLIPGVHHGRGGPGLTEFDALTALEKWVERGPPPKLIACHRDNGVIERCRPVFPYPDVGSLFRQTRSEGGREFRALRLLPALSSFCGSRSMRLHSGRMVGYPYTTTHPAQGFGSMPMRSLTADRIRCLQPR
jgi:Tannase and feruloyl esterase